LLTYIAMSQKIAEAAVPEEASPGASILNRMKHENRGPLLRLSVQDHYTEVVTGRGRELVLLRFADALKETAATPG
ncbi:DNA-binding protein, partial [Rhizobium ruizarguesonis]